MKTIDIAMIAWPKTPTRAGYMDRTLGSIRENAVASRHEVVLRVSLEMVDVSPDNFQLARRICEKYGAIPHWRGKQPSLGGNNNDALMLGHGQFVVLNQEDWCWSHKTDISDDADFLEENPDFAMVRFSMHYYDAESVLRARGDGRNLISIKIGEQGYVYGGEPHMRRMDFAVRRSSTGGEPVGFYRVGESPMGNYADPENTMSGHLRSNGWRVAGYSPNLCDHFSTESTRPVELGGVAAC